MIAHVSRFRLIAVLSGAWALASASLASAQSLNEGMTELKNRYRNQSTLINNLFKGNIKADPRDKQHIEAIDLAAKWDTHRVYLDHLENPAPNSRETIARAYQECASNIAAITKNAAQMQPLADLYGEKLREHALEVIQWDKAKPIHKIHNARVLAESAKLGQGKLADTLLKVLEDKNQNGAVALYTLQGLGELLAQTPAVLNKDQEAKCGAGIVAFLNGLTPPPKKASPAEIDGFRYLRREGVRALAQIHVPLVNDKVRPALVLARFAGGDERIQPPPRIDERLEAAIGLARMKSSAGKGYQADYAANMIGKFLSAFGSVANNNPKGGANQRRRPWKHDAYRMSVALEALKADSGKDKFVGEVITKGNHILQAVMQEKPANAGDLSWFTTAQGESPNKELFKNVADSTVKPAEASEK